MYSLLNTQNKNTSIDEVTFNINKLTHVADVPGGEKATLEIRKATCCNKNSLLGFVKLLETVKSWTVQNFWLPGGVECHRVRGDEAGVTVSRAKCYDTDSLNGLFFFLQNIKSWTVETLELPDGGVCNTVRRDKSGVSVRRAECLDDWNIQSLIKILNARNSWTVDNLEVRSRRCNNRTACQRSPCALHTLLDMQGGEKIVKTVVDT